MKQTFIGIMVVSLFLIFVNSVQANADVAFAYQGRVKVHGTPFSGNGEFKFAIVSTSGNRVLWSHDGSSNTTGIPDGSVTLPVENGIFNVIIGDVSSGMNPINSTIFNSDSPLKLRVWFNDGSRGFQQLHPDFNLINLALTTLQSSQTDFTIYVDNENGNDSNNGLTTSTAKATIQAAVDTLPERIRCNVTIDVAEGTYKETVKILGISVEPGKVVKIVGDETWTGSGDPTVRITGADNDTTPTRGLEHGFTAVQCSGVELTGFQLDNFSQSAAQLDNGIFNIENCKIRDSQIGVSGSASLTTCSKLDISHCTVDGMYFTGQSAVVINDCSSVSNVGCGLKINAGSAANLQGTGNFSNNGISGYRVQHHSAIVFSLRQPAYTGLVSGNGEYGMDITYQSYCENQYANDWGSGNERGNIRTLYGGITTY